MYAKATEQALGISSEYSNGLKRFEVFLALTKP